jgi:hypothetical protein
MEGHPRLESWKEISSYLGRSIKTCQRWEVELGLPIHRLDGTPRARVFAEPAELDAWMTEKLSHIRARPGARAKLGWDARKFDADGHGVPRRPGLPRGCRPALDLAPAGQVSCRDFVCGVPAAGKDVGGTLGSKPGGHRFPS